MRKMHDPGREYVASFSYSWHGTCAIDGGVARHADPRNKLLPMSSFVRMFMDGAPPPIMRRAVATRPLRARRGPRRRDLGPPRQLARRRYPRRGRPRHLPRWYRGDPSVAPALARSAPRERAFRPPGIRNHLRSCGRARMTMTRDKERTSAHSAGVRRPCETRSREAMEATLPRHRCAAWGMASGAPGREGRIVAPRR
jgi:hypothetical protein